MIASAPIAYLLSASPGGLVALLLDVIFLALLGPSVENTLRRVRFCALCLVGGLLSLGVRTFTGADSPSPALFAISGAIVAVLAAYLPLHPRGRVLTLVLVPFVVTIVEIPAAILLGAWLAAQLYLGAIGSH